jgi:hypothetical protein
MTAIESIIIVAVCAALGWVAARVYGWRRKRAAIKDSLIPPTCWQDAAGGVK